MLMYIFSLWVLQWVMAGLLVMNTDSFNMLQIIHLETTLAVLVFHTPHSKLTRIQPTS